MGRLRAPIRPEGAVTEVTIGPSASARASAKLERPPIRVQALFDTGADITVIHHGLARQLGIYPHDQAEIVGVHDTSASCDVFDVDLEFPGSGIVLRDLTVVESKIVSAPRIQVLIGRSVLWKGILTYDGTRQEFTFEIPTDPG